MHAPSYGVNDMRAAKQMVCRLFPVLIVVSGPLLAPNAWASGMQPTCDFALPKKAVSAKSHYNVAGAYRKADLVVTGLVEGSVGDARSGKGITLNLRITTVIKGRSKPQIINLRGARCHGTACSGLSIAHRVEMLFFLRRETDGRYYKVDGSGNDACPNIFLSEEDGFLVGDQVVARKKLRQFLSRAKPIAYP